MTSELAIRFTKKRFVALEGSVYLNLERILMNTYCDSQKKFFMHLMLALFHTLCCGFMLWLYSGLYSGLHVGALFWALYWCFVQGEGVQG